MRLLTRLLAFALVTAALSANISQAYDGTALALGPAAAASGEIAAAGQVDRYTLDTLKGRTYVIETFAVARGSGEGTLLSVYTEDGRRLAWGTAGAGDADRTLELIAPSNEPLDVRVSGRGAWREAYRLRALAARGEPGAAWDARGEPDSWCSIGHPLAVGGEATGDIAAPDPGAISRYPDGDSYVIDLARGRSYAVVVDGLPADAPEGALLLIVSEKMSEFMLGSSRSGAGGAPAQMSITPRADTRYCVIVAGLGPAPWPGAYRVRAVELVGRVLVPIVAR